MCRARTVTQNSATSLACVTRKPWPAHLFNVLRPRIYERHVLASTYHTGADIAANGAYPDDRYFPVQAHLQASRRADG
jgi:hypothetical protein